MTPLFIDGRAGSLFILHHEPVAQTGARGALILVPPFAEELNRSRHMLAKAARRLAALGWHAVILDLYGTGDSAGEFVDGRWDIWQSDILSARQWLQARGHETIGLLALRTGCLLAGDVMAEAAWGPVVFWQPVLQGKTFLTQFLRVGLAAGLGAGGGNGTTVNSLRERLAGGETLEIAGYELHPALVDALDAAVLTPDASWPQPLRCIEVGAQSNALTPGLARAVEAWRSHGVTVDATAVQGPQFWMLQEPEWADALIDVSCSMLEPSS